MELEPRSVVMGVMKRQPGWKQANPRDQLRVLMGAVEGHISNVEEGIGEIDDTLPRTRKLLRDCQRLAGSLPGGNFDEEIAIRVIITENTVARHDGDAYWVRFERPDGTVINTGTHFSTPGMARLYVEGATALLPAGSYEIDDQIGD